MALKRGEGEAGAAWLKLNLRKLAALRQIEGGNQGQGNQATLPLDVALPKELPAKLTVTSKLPSLRRSPEPNFERSCCCRLYRVPATGGAGLIPSGSRRGLANAFSARRSRARHALSSPFPPRPVPPRSIRA